MLNMDVSENSGFSPNHPFCHRVFHYFHHPFWVFFPYFWFNTHLIEMMLQTTRCLRPAPLQPSRHRHVHPAPQHSCATARRHDPPPANVEAWKGWKGSTPHLKLTASFYLRKNIYHINVYFQIRTGSFWEGSWRETLPPKNSWFSGVHGLPQRKMSKRSPN